MKRPGVQEVQVVTYILIASANAYYKRTTTALLHLKWVRQKQLVVIITGIVPQEIHHSDVERLNLPLGNFVLSRPIITTLATINYFRDTYSGTDFC